MAAMGDGKERPGNKRLRSVPVDLQLPEYVRFELWWYQRAAAVAHYGHLGSQSVAILSALLVPVSSAGGWGDGWTGLLGIAAAAGSGLGLLFRFRSNFVTRSIALEQIRSAVARYAAKPPAARDDARLVAEITRIVEAETAEWQQSTATPDDDAAILKKPGTDIAERPVPPPRHDAQA